MNPLSPPARPPASALHTRRCVRHGEREAAARCPACGRFFCRECVVEHEGRLLCAECLARAAHAKPVSGPRGRRVRKALALGAAAALAWLMFYTAGVLLLKFPPAFHEGTVWDARGTP